MAETQVHKTWTLRLYLTLGEASNGVKLLLVLELAALALPGNTEMQIFEF